MAVAERPPQLVYRPHPKQEPWHACPAYESGFGGTKGPGKTQALLMEALRGIHHPRYRAVIFRRTYKRLQEVMERAWEWFPGLGGVWRGDEYQWTFPKGGKILFRHCQHEEDKRNYNGHQWHFLGVDQLEEFTESIYLFLLAQNRTGIRELPAYTRSTFNPGGIGHAWVKERFIAHGSRECAPWTPTNDEGDPLPSRCFHFASLDDNPTMAASDPGYRQRLDALPLDERRALKEGDWDVFAGQVLTQWRRQRHVIRPWRLPRHWPRWRCVDYGTARPFVCLWLCQDPGTLRVYVYREISRAGVVPASKQAQMIAEATGLDEQIQFTVADPAMWIRQADTGVSIADIYASAGVPCEQASNDRLSGLSRVRDFLDEGPDGCPFLQVFETCPQLIKNLPSLVYDTHTVEDVDTDGPDDEYDALRYGLMAAHWMLAAQQSYPRKRGMVMR